jgi:hypothetical protein
MPVLIDGNNLLHSLPRDQRSRGDVRRRALEQVRNEGVRITVVFDGPPPAGSPSTEHLGRVTVRYSGSATADDLLISLIPDGRSSKQWVVVTDDRGLRDRARARGAGVRTLAQWQGRRRPRVRRGGHEPRLSSNEIADWEEFFSSGGRGEGESG